MTKQYFKYLLILLLFVIAGRLTAQTYPVQAGVFLQPPYSVHLSDYALPGSQRLSIQLLLRDMTKPELPVRLKFRITNQQGIEITTRQSYLPAPFMLESNMPLRLSGAELGGYLAAENLDFQGISRSAFVRGGQALPEGLYQVYVEAYEYYGGARVSNQAYAMAWMILNDPPLLNLPSQNEKPRAMDPQNLVFQWTPRHTGSPNAAFSTEYEFSLVEIWPANRNPNDAMLSTPPIFRTTTRSSMLVYGPAEMPLMAGRKYAWRVQAKSITGTDELNLFKNEGYSEVYTFQWGDECLLPLEVKAVALSNGRIKLEWESQQGHTTFSVRYREKSDKNSRWYEKDSYRNELVLTDLKHSTAYEYQVSGMCGSVAGGYTALSSITTQPYEEPAFACGLPLEGFSNEEVPLLASLQPGDVIHAGDFQVELSVVSGSGGTFKGHGIVLIPMMNKAKVNVEFENIQVDENYRMKGGFMNLTGAKLEVVPAELLEMMDKLDETLNKVDGVLADIDKGLELSQQILDEVGGLANEILDNGPFTKEEEALYATASVAEYKNSAKEKAAAANSLWAAASTPEEYTAAARNVAQAIALKKRADRLQNIYSGSDTVAVIAVEFTGASQWGFDAQAYAAHRLHYNIIVTPDNQAHGVPWISAQAGQRNTAIARFKENGSVAAENIIFKSGEEQLTASRSGNEWTIQLPEVAAGRQKSVVALDGAGGKLVGKLDVIAYKKAERKVNLVSVNGASLKDLTPELIKAELNRVYGQAVAEWEVQELTGLTIEGFSGTLQDDEQALLSTYSTGMKDIIKAFQSRGEYKKDEFYLFIVANSQTNKSGYMPRKHRYGFIYAAGAENKAHTIAHELGHGAFRLQHTFEEYPTIAEQTQNLMDYGAGTVLRKYQWDMIHNPPVVVGLVEDVEEGSLAEVTDLKQLAGFVNADGSLTFVSPSGLPITLPANTESVVFATGESWKSDKFKIVPFGAVVAFSINKKKYTARAGSSGNFLYYRHGESDQDIFSEKLTASQKPEKAIIGYPCYNGNGEVTFSVYQKSLIVDYGKINTDNKAAGPLVPYDFLIDFYLSGRSTTTALNIDAEHNLSHEAVDYLQWRKDYATCDNALAPYVFIHAYQITYNPGTYHYCEVYSDLRAAHPVYKFLDQLPLSFSGALAKDEITQYYEGVKSWSSDLAIYKKRSLALKQLDQLSTITDRDELISLLKELESYSCIWEGIKYTDRLYTLKKLLEGNLTDSWVILTSEENLFNQILETTPVGVDRVNLLKALSENQNELLVKAYRALDMGSNDQFIATLTSWSEQIKSNEIDELTFLQATPTYSGEWIVPANMTLWNDNLDKNKVFEKHFKEDNGLFSYYSRNDKKYLSVDPLALVKIKFESNFEGGIKAGTEMIVPVIWAYQFQERYYKGKLADAARVFFDAAIIINTLGTGSGVLAALEISFAAGDIMVVGVKDDLIGKWEKGEEFVKGWDNIYALYGAAVGVAAIQRVGIGIGKTGWKVNAAEMAKSIKSFSAESRAGLKKEFEGIAAHIATWGKQGKILNWEKAYYQCLDYAQTINLQSFQAATDKVILKVKDYSRVVAVKGLLEYEIAKYELRNGVPHLSGISWLPQVVPGKNVEILDQLGPVKYENKLLIEEIGIVEIVWYEGAAYIRNIGKGGDEVIASLTGSIKSTYDDIIKAGLKSEVKANSILLKNATGETVAIIYNGKLTPTKWAWQKNFSSTNKTATSEGYIIIKDRNELKFDLGFKEGRKLEANEVNDYLVNGQGKDLDGQPYWAGTQVDEVVLGKKGETVYFVENYNGGAANPGQYASKDPITTIKELRENLAVKEAWKETTKEPTLRAYRVKADLKARSGIIGRQSDNGIELPGGAHQYEIIDYLGGNWKNYLEEVGPKNGFKLK